MFELVAAVLGAVAFGKTKRARYLWVGLATVGLLALLVGLLIVVAWAGSEAADAGRSDASETQMLIAVLVGIVLNSALAIGSIVFSIAGLVRYSEERREAAYPYRTCPPPACPAPAYPAPNGPAGHQQAQSWAPPPPPGS